MTDDSKMYKLRWSARARAREGAVAYRNIRTGESVNVSKIWDTSPTCWARSKFEFPALDFLLPMGEDASKPHCHVRDVTPHALAPLMRRVERDVLETSPPWKAQHAKTL